MKEDLMLLRTMPWKHRIIMAMVFLMGFFMIYITSSSQVVMIKSILLYTVFTFVSYIDYRFRIIPDWMHLIILAIGFININVAMSLFGLAISPLPFLIMELIHKGSIGGGDIKLLGSTGFVMGYSFTSMASIVGLLIVVLVTFLNCISKRSDRIMYFPFAPYLQIGLTIVIVCKGRF